MRTHAAGAHARLFAPYVALAVTSLWLRTGFPLHAIAGADFDDYLFYKISDHLLHGRWLGPYDDLTLIKGPFYPAFIALTTYLALPLKIAEHIVWICAAGLAARYAAIHTGSRWLSLALFGVLVFNPVLFNNALARIIREGLYISLSPLLVIGLCWLAYRKQGIEPWQRSGVLHVIVPGAVLGALAAAFWVTREEGVWLVPALLAVAACWGLHLKQSREWRSFGELAGTAVRTAFAATVASALVMFALVVEALRLQNWCAYGIHATTAFAYKPFLDAYGALSRIRHDDWKPHVVLPKDARERAYGVSPAARELAATLDGPRARYWRTASCNHYERTNCDEILAGHFMWALRDAVARAGHHKTGEQAREFYLRLAREVNEACDAGKIPCHPARSGMSPPFRWQYVRTAIATVPGVAARMLTLREGNVGTRPSFGPRVRLLTIEHNIGPIHEPFNSQRFAFRAVASSSIAAPQVGFIEKPGKQFDMVKALVPARDLETQFPAMHFSRFVIDSGCQKSDCALVVAAGGRNLVVPLDEIAAGRTFGTPEIGLRVEQAATEVVMAMPGGVAQRRSVQVAAANIASRGYALAIPLLFAVGVVGLFWRLISTRLRLAAGEAAIAALVLASLVAVAMRIALLSYLDAAAIPSVNLLYASPATPFVLIVSVLGPWLAARSGAPRPVAADPSALPAAG